MLLTSNVDVIIYKNLKIKIWKITKISISLLQISNCIYKYKITMPMMSFTLSFAPLRFVPWLRLWLSTCSKMLNIASNNCKIFKVQVLNQPGLPFGSDYYKIAHTWNKSLVFCKRWGPKNLNLCYSTRLQAWIQVKYMENDVIYVKIIIIVKICYRSKNIRSLYKLNLLLNKYYVKM